MGKISTTRSGHASPTGMRNIPERKVSGGYSALGDRYSSPTAVSPVAVSPPKFAGAALSSSPLVWGSTVWGSTPSAISPKHEFSTSLPADNGVWGTMASPPRSRALSAGWEEDARELESPALIFEKTAVNVDKARSRTVSESHSEAATVLYPLTCPQWFLSVL